MDELAGQIAERLVEPFATASPPPSLHPRIMRRAAAIRRRRAVTTAVATAVAVMAVLVAVPAVTRPSGPAPPDPAVTTTADSDSLADLVDLGAAVRISRELPGQELPFRALGLGPDGTVLGIPTEMGHGESGNPFGTGVWRAGSAGGAPELVVDTSQEVTETLWKVAVSEAGYLWPRGDQLACLGPGGHGPERTFRAGWGGRAEFHADGEVFVWSDHWRAVMVADGCGAPVRRIAVSGEVLAFADPYAYVWSEATLLQVNVIDENVREFRDVEPSFSAMAASARSVAWVVGDTLTVADPRTAAPTLTVTDLPYGDDHERPTRITIGERIIVYSVDEGTAVAFDLRNGRAVRLPDYEAWTAGNWLLWRDGEEYLLAPTRP